MADIRIGTCSWKYPDWQGLVYSTADESGYLREYAQHFDCVEIDQWYYSLFGPGKVVLPQAKVAAEYAASVPDGFRFGVKMPNALTLTHYRPARKIDPLVANPHFLSLDLLNMTLDRLEPMRSRLGPLMFQFSYLNRQMIESQAAFLDQLASFAGHLPRDLAWGIETRNPHYLNNVYFEFLKQHGLMQVFEMGYYMPPVKPLYETHAEQLIDQAVIRLHGPDRQGMEARTGKAWSQIIESRDADVADVTGVVADMKKRGKRAWVFVNNHFEGCAPRSIVKIREKLR